MSAHSLPRELVDKIVKHITEKADLFTASLVSSHFLPSTRPILFSDICILADPREKYNKVQAFIAFLTSTPEIAKLIRNLTLQRREYGPIISTQPYLSVACDSLDDLLSTLPRLQSLRLIDVQLHLSKPLSDLSHARYGLERFSITESIGQHYAVVALGLFSQIGELSVSSMSESRRSGQPLGSPFDFPLHEEQPYFPHNLTVSGVRLECNVSDAEFYTELLRRTLTPQTLRSFTLVSNAFTTQFRSTSAIFDLLHAAAPHLTHVTLGTSDLRRTMSLPAADAQQDYTSAAMRSKLSSLTALQSLTLHFVHRATSATPRAIAPRGTTFAELISLLASFPLALREVRFSFEDAKRTPPDSRRPRVSWCSPELNLQVLQPLLLGYRELTSVVFESWNGVSSAEREHIAKALPEIVRRGLLRFAE